MPTLFLLNKAHCIGHFYCHHQYEFFFSLSTQGVFQFYQTNLPASVHPAPKDIQVVREVVRTRNLRTQLDYPKTIRANPEGHHQYESQLKFLSSNRSWMILYLSEIYELRVETEEIHRRESSFSHEDYHVRVSNFGRLSRGEQMTNVQSENGTIFISGLLMILKNVSPCFNLPN